MALDLRTPKERERDARHSQIVQFYKELSQQNPNYKPNRYIEMIAPRVGMSGLAIRQILKKRGVI